MNYEKHYTALMDRARNRELTCYTERHHIIPRCIGGDDDESNIVRLTPEEHFVSHQLLVKMFPGDRKLVFALCAMRMSGSTNSKSNNKMFGWLRRKMAKAISEEKKGKKRPPQIAERMRIYNATRGPDSPETRAKRAASLKGKKKSPEHVAKVAKAMLGKPGPRKGVKLSKETREKQRQAALKRSHPGKKLNAGIIRQIKAALEKPDASGSEIARRFGISPQSVCDIKHGRKWSHVT